jgi:MarR family transcriptional regulator, organic hydroperoxide resistance regulator
LLRILSERDGRSQKEIADLMEITPATLNVMIGRMEKNELVLRKPDPDDQRISRVYLTEKGMAAHKEIRSVMDTMEGICFDNFSPEEKIIFRRLLLQMYENLKKAGIGLDGPEER